MCLKNIKHISKYSHFASKFHQEFDKCKYIILYHKDIDINDVDESFSLYMMDHNKKFVYYLVRCQYKLIFNDYEYSPYVECNLSDNKTLIP